MVKIAMDKSIRSAVYLFGRGLATTSLSQTSYQARPSTQRNFSLYFQSVVACASRLSSSDLHRRPTRLCTPLLCDLSLGYVETFASRETSGESDPTPHPESIPDMRPSAARPLPSFLGCWHYTLSATDHLSRGSVLRDWGEVLHLPAGLG